MTRTQAARWTTQEQFKEDEAMTDKEQATMLIDSYMNLQRIISAQDMKMEVEYQIKGIRAKLEALGIVAENLDIDRTTK